ncbi:MAG: class I SAM-dependent methyltransferase [Patescibacteria group bacterium]
MTQDRKWYKWFYDNIHSHYYDLMIKLCFLPFGGEEKHRDELTAHVDFSHNDRILDMCCGTGGATFTIAKKVGKGTEIIGIDLSSGQINIAKRKNRLVNVKFIEGDAAGTEFEDGYFDKIFITHALHEMPRETRLNVLKEARRILKIGGRIIVLELDNPQNFFVRLFIGLWLFYWLPFNFETPTRREMLKYGLTNEVKKSGFKNIRKISKHNGVFQIVEGEK